MTYQQALAIVQKYMAEKHPDWECSQKDFENEEIDNLVSWTKSRFEFTIELYFDKVWLQKYKYEDLLFSFYFPATKEEFLTLMSILDK